MFAQKLEKKREAAEKRAHRQLMKERASELKTERKRQRSDPLPLLVRKSERSLVPPALSRGKMQRTRQKMALQGNLIEHLHTRCVTQIFELKPGVESTGIVVPSPGFGIFSASRTSAPASCALNAETAPPNP